MVFRKARETVHVHDVQARLRLLEAVTLLDALQMGLHAATTRRARGLLLGGPIGADLVAQAEAWMQDEGIADIEAMTRMMAPCKT